MDASTSTNTTTTNNNMETKQGSWILGGEWNNDLWGGDLLVASWIGDVTPNNPVWLSRMDGHMGLDNSLALILAGITNLTHNPRGGTIVRTASGGGKCYVADDESLPFTFCCWYQFYESSL